MVEGTVLQLAVVAILIYMQNVWKFLHEGIASEQFVLM